MNKHLFWGIDGCKGGWIAIGVDDRNHYLADVFPNIQTFWNEHGEQARMVLIDMPIGLSSDADGRQTEDAARELLQHRRSSVFNVPTRNAIAYGGEYGFTNEAYKVACDINRQVEGKAFSKQSWNISPKIHEIDLFLRENPRRKHHFLESHPEILFWSLNRKQAMKYSKKIGLGFIERVSLLKPHLPNAMDIIQAVYDKHASVLVDDDIVDALVCAVCARLPKLTSLPRNPRIDCFGLPMQMVYPQL